MKLPAGSKSPTLALVIVVSMLLAASVAADPPRARVILLHGLLRSPSSMATLAERLEKAGYETHNIGYDSSNGDPEQLLAEVAQKITACCSDESAPLHFVTHSLGGILVRIYIASERPPNLGRVVMLAPPNHGSEIVDVIGEWVLSELILGPTGMALGTGAESLPRQLEAPDYPVGVIAGDRSVNPIGSLMIPGDDDGTVSIESAKLPGMADFIALDVTHTFMMYDDEVGRQVVHFLEFGKFSDDPS